MAKRAASTTKKATSSVQPNTVLALVAYLIFFVPLLTDAKDDPFVKYHVKQGLVLFLAWIGVTLFTMVPVLGWVLGPIFGFGLFILLVIGILNAVNGEMKPLPLIGQYADSFNL